MFQHVITSFELGLRKPEPMVYRKALEILGQPADAVVYTDDRPELVASAKRLGIRAFVFRGIEELKKDFLEAGISLGSEPICRVKRYS